MARRIISRKRKHYGNRTFGGGNTKNRRGKGCRGGVGRAGWHKHNWLRTIKSGEHKQLVHGFTSVRPRLKAVTLGELSQGISEGKFKGGVIVLKGVKVISNGDLRHKVTVKATAFSKKAIDKIRAAGGEASSV